MVKGKANLSSDCGETTLMSPDLGFISPTPIDKPDEDGERGTGYNYECDSVLDGYNIPQYEGSLKITAPFSYQVAGHDPFLKAQGGLLCKPVVPRELWFYLQLERFPEYKSLVAGFLGCVEYSTSDIFSFTKDGNKEDYMTPWAEKVHLGHLQRINSKIQQKHSNLSRQHRYLVLNNLTAKFQWPCVMDLKIGQRAYGDDATPKKIASQTLKSQQTTSHSTGLRVCGCQGYSALTGGFWQLHKYEGRKITKDTMPLAFQKFFHNDKRLRVDVIQNFIEKAENIRDVVRKKEFRFYSTSLLLVYDGEAEEPCTYLKMIDFAHTFPADNDKAIDDGYMLGINNLISLLRSLC